MFDEADGETGYALVIVIVIAVIVSIFMIGNAARTAIGQLGKQPTAAPAASATVPAQRTTADARPRGAPSDDARESPAPLRRAEDSLR